MSIPSLSQAVNGQPGASAVRSAIWQASQETGVDFAYLMEKAAVESGFRPELKATTSSATGLFQFIDSTWLGAMKAHGAEHGLGNYAAAIQKQSDGSYTVADPDMRRQILDLRKDPKISAELAAELTRENKSYLESKVTGRTIGPTELYLAHFLGANGASRFLNAMQQNPSQLARDVMPDAAKSNAAVFYDHTNGTPKTLAQVYDRFAQKFSATAGDVVTGSGGTPLGHMLTSIGNERNPVTALNAIPLSGYTMLALAALQTPDETSSSHDTLTAYGSRHMGATTQSSTTSMLTKGTHNRGLPGAK